MEMRLKKKTTKKKKKQKQETPAHTHTFVFPFTRPKQKKHKRPLYKKEKFQNVQPKKFVGRGTSDALLMVVRKKFNHIDVNGSE